MELCDWTDRIEASALRRSFDDEERAHLNECPECRKLTRIVQRLTEHGRSAERRSASHVPSAAAVLQRAREIRARKTERRVLRPIVWVEAIGVLTALAAAALTVAWGLRRLQTSSSLDALGRSLRAQSLGTPSLLTTAMVVTAVVVIAAGLYGLGGIEVRGTRRLRR